MTMDASLIPGFGYGAEVHRSVTVLNMESSVFPIVFLGHTKARNLALSSESAKMNAL